MVEPSHDEEGAQNKGADPDVNQPVQVTYRELMANITRTANLFHDLGVGPQDVVSYLLPNLPQTHYVLWGGEAAGIVNPINPLLEPATIAEICQAAGTKILVALADFPESDIWQKVMAIRSKLPDLMAIIRVMGSSDEKNGIYGYDEIIGRYNREQLDSKREIVLFDSPLTVTVSIRPR